MTLHNPEQKVPMSDPLSAADALLVQVRALPLPAAREATLHVLADLLRQEAVGPADVLAETDDEAFVERGRRVGSETLLKVVPSFLYSALHGLQQMNDLALSRLYLDPAVFAVLSAEAQRLADMLATLQQSQAEHATQGVVREVDSGVTRRTLIGHRDNAAAQLVAVLPRVRRPEVLNARGTAETDASLVRGARAVATLLETTFAEGQAPATLLLRRRVSPAMVTVLRSQADTYAQQSQPTARAPRRIDQRSLDLQDGLVLALMDQVVSAWRGVVSAGSPVPLPDVGDLGWLFGITVARAPVEEAPSKPEPDPTPAPSGEPT